MLIVVPDHRRDVVAEITAVDGMGVGAGPHGREVTLEQEGQCGVDLWMAMFVDLDDQTSARGFGISCGGRASRDGLGQIVLTMSDQVGACVDADS
ncbi:hypothetical protein [Kibdelosporangium phytohabitans]|uniref:Uncharacterized protein n=1 Tax=Kibdelosporangium phytohabitans TaxID=860235 RepID=A0A0N9HJH5_9PSEU|nr:hypothetical protein [Kibdelosporangium phytohabitans]ALG06200.1 hypothetical protein AOZ06_04005 [Kibdelosporangium phytohabitans]MBE1465701.1 hypothetical protein [Kibdelosporangium phytohabitans]